MCCCGAILTPSPTAVAYNRTPKRFNLTKVFNMTTQAVAAASTKRVEGQVSAAVTPVIDSGSPLYLTLYSIPKHTRAIGDDSQIIH